MEMIEGDHLDPRLYLDYGDGYSEDYAFYLTQLDKDRWRGVMPMPCLIKTIRLDPSCKRGVIRPPELSVRPVDLSSLFEQVLSEESANESLMKTVRGIVKLAERKRRKSPDRAWTVSTLTGAISTALNASTSKSQSKYLEWVEKYDTISESDRTNMLDMVSGFKTRPIISVIIPVYNTNLKLLEQAIESVLAQTYPYFEVCIADDAWRGVASPLAQGRGS
jgi:O-antigen biosynthesis protein